MPNPPTQTPPHNENDDLSALSDLAAEVIGDDDINIPTHEESRFRRPTTPPEERFPPLLDDYTPIEDVMPAVNAPKPKPAPRKQGGGCFYNLMTLIFLLGTGGLIAYYYQVWVDPYSPLNPLAPPTPFIEVSATPDTVALATYESELTLAAIRPTAQAMVDMPTLTPAPDVSVTPSEPATPTNTPRPEYVFTLQEPGVTYAQNPNQRGCNWASIRGTIYGRNGQLLDGYRIRIIDVEDPGRLDVSVTSGVLPDLGAGVYEQLLGSTPRIRRYTIQLYDNQGLAVSEPYLIFTRDECAENIAEVNFEQVR
jgi:hypothetical protein